jgi:hypothetical protein
VRHLNTLSERDFDLLMQASLDHTAGLPVAPVLRDALPGWQFGVLNWSTVEALLDRRTGAQAAYRYGGSPCCQPPRLISGRAT